jgi:hypothetical protein
MAINQPEVSVMTRAEPMSPPGKVEHRNFAARRRLALITTSGL